MFAFERCIAEEYIGYKGARYKAIKYIHIHVRTLLSTHGFSVGIVKFSWFQRSRSKLYITCNAGHDSQTVGVFIETNT